MFLQNISFTFLIHLVMTSIMVGVIWVIQLVHYPSFHFIKLNMYTVFQKFHMEKISIIVIPVMVAELVTAFLLLYYEESRNTLLIISVIILIFIWGITVVFFSGVHNKLMVGYNEIIVNHLVVMNWVRTLLWTMRLLLLFSFLIFRSDKWYKIILVFQSIECYYVCLSIII